MSEEYFAEAGKRDVPSFGNVQPAALAVKSN
jgi:hypothetical protein